MKAFINGHQVSGHPKEIAELLQSLERPKPAYRKPAQRQAPPQPAPIAPGVADTIAESQQLRQQLQADPNYNPYGGVLPGQQDAPMQLDPPQRRLYAAEADTGVSYES